ncbi:hypothetical protein [Pseudomonas sp. W2-17]|uniref:hypothetical protein n=1 Tax=Pseudomonas sp. W2-17 TaxID=3058039 RepID=UPI0034E076D3
MALSPQDPSLTSSAPNSLIELEIPGRVGPLPEPPAAPGETLWGINHGAALDNFPQRGLQLYIPAWSNMLMGDSVSVLLEDTAVTTAVIDDPAEVNQRVTAFVDAVRLTEGKHTLQYRVARIGQVPESSADTEVLVKLARPGGQDQNGETPGHSALTFTLPQDIIDNGVDKDIAELGVPVTIKPYPNMVEGDDIKLSWGGEFVHHKVTADDVGQSIEITVEEAVILAGGDSGPNGLAVTFEVYDVVDNRSEDWAAETRIVVDTGNSRLDAPFINEAIDNVLDLDTLGNNAVTVQVAVGSRLQFMAQFSALLGKKLTAQLEASLGKGALKGLAPLKADFAVGDQIFVTLTGNTADGDALRYEAEPVTIDRLGHVFDISMPNAQIRQLAKTQAVFAYTLKDSSGASKAVSKGAFINVIGETVRMAAPVALDAQQGAIDPALPSTVVQIPWDDSMAAGDQLTLKWLGTRSNFSIYDPELTAHNISQGEATRKDPINFTVPGMHLKPIEGGTLELYFILAKDVGGTIVNRESARATTLNIGEPRAELTKPLVDGVVEGVIDPDHGATTLTVPVYMEMAIRDDVHYLWHGSVGGNVEDSLTINSLTLNRPVVFEIASKNISANDGGTVEASYWVMRASGIRSDSDVLAFSVGQPVVLDPPVISSVRDSKGQEIANNGSTFDTSVTLSGTAAVSQGVEVFDGDDSKGNATANPSGQWSLGIGGLTVSSHAIKAKALYGDQAESAAWTVNVMVNSAYPVIISIKDSMGNEIPDHGNTSDRALTFAGTSYPNSEVKIYDAATDSGGGELIGTALTNADGQWESKLAVPERTSHQVWILGNGAPSRVRYFTLR